MADRVVECIIPILRVLSLSNSLKFYAQLLGFEVDWGGEPGSSIASVSRDGCHIMLTESAESPPGNWVWIGLADDAWFERLQAQGVKVRQQPRNFSWAYEMKFEDPDGNVLWMGTESKADLPRQDAMPPNQ